MAQKWLWNVSKKRMLEDRGVLPTEERDLIRKYKAVHEENFFQMLVKGGHRKQGQRTGWNEKEG